MDTAQLDVIRAQLLTRRAEIEGDIARLDDEMVSLGTEQGQERGGTGNHLADDGSSVMEQERIGTIGEDLRDVVRQIDGALSRIADGTYGTCMRCKRPINEERLEAFPYVEYDVECQAILEREQRLYGSTQRAV